MTVSFDDVSSDAFAQKLKADQQAVRFVSPLDQKAASEGVFASQMLASFFTALTVAKGKRWFDLGRTWVQAGQFHKADFDRLVTDVFVATFTKGTTAALVGSAQIGARSAQAEFTEPIFTEALLGDWASVYSNKMAQQVAEGSTLAIEDLVHDGLNARLPASVLAERAAALYGVDQRSANALKAYGANKTLPRNSTVPDMLNKMLSQRALLIGGNETVTAINFGRQITYMKAIENGLLPKNATKTWVTALDERVCPVCKPMDGVTVPILDTFEVMLPLPKTGRGKNRKSSKHVVPPVHPNCRCTIVTTERLEHGIITRVARFDDLPGTKHRSRLVSEAGDLIFQ